MAQTPLITLTQQQIIKPIDANNTDNYTLIEDEVERSEMVKLIGAAFLKDLRENPTSNSNNKLLIEGGTFTDCNDNQTDFKGLRYVMAYLVYCNYINESSVKDTFSGLKYKNTEQSERIESGKLKEITAKYYNIAMQEFELCKEFLNLNDTLFPFWNCTTQKKLYTPKITNVNKSGNYV